MQSNEVINEIINYLGKILPKVNPDQCLKWKLCFDNINYSVYVHIPFKEICVDFFIIKLLQSNPINVVNTAFYNSNIDSKYRKKICNFLYKEIIKYDIMIIDSNINILNNRLTSMEQQLAFIINHLGGQQ